VRILKIKTPGEFVVFLIEGAAGSEDSYGHERICAEHALLSKFGVGGPAFWGSIGGTTAVLSLT
jgi:hypothetical protein